MKYGLLLLLIGAVLIGCSSAGDVSTEGVSSKEKQIDEATKKLGAENRDQGQ